MTDSYFLLVVIHLFKIQNLFQSLLINTLKESTKELVWNSIFLKVVFKFENTFGNFLKENDF